ncbi:hypothetical protein BFW01_g5733 [Lasiodiplodia theobromae]|nr:hypothetical protein BFW01_g5733 [Lasiodiplodia theobromae]
MRTYSHLIQSENDFATATRGPPFLIPPEDDQGNPITYERWLDFIQPFADLKDKDVSPRYQYGELRLTRLNQCARIFLRELTFHHIDGQWGSYLQRYLTPSLSAFAVFSIILNAMQVGMAVESLNKGPHHPVVFSYVSWWFSILTLGFATTGVLFILFLVLFMSIHDVWFARASMKNKGIHSGAVKI